MLAERVREVAELDRISALGHEDELIDLRPAPQFAPRAQRTRDAGIERPRARVVGLVLVEPNRAALEIEIAPRESLDFALPHPFAREEAVEHAMRKRHLRAREQQRVFV